MLTFKRAAGLLYAHFLTMVVAGILLFALSFLVGNKIGLVVFALLTTLIYFSIVYGSAWEFGHRDRRKSSPITPHVARGFYLGTLASIPAILIWLASIMAKIGWLPLYLETTTEPFYYLDAVYRVCFVMSLPIFSIAEKYGTVWSLLAIVQLPIFAGIGYIAGMKDYDLLASVRGKIVYEKKKK